MTQFNAFTKSVLAASFAALSSISFADVTIYKADQIIDGDGVSNDAIAVDNGRVIKRASLASLTKDYASAPVVTFNGTMMPGLIDAHGHLLGMGQQLQTVDLAGAESLEEALQRVKAFADANPDLPWIMGGRWDQNDCYEHAARLADED